MPPTRPSNTISVFDFTRSELCEQIAVLSGGRQHGGCFQAEYLAQYLCDIGACSFITESFYIDRHYLEECAHYYSRCLLHKQNSASRIHVFSIPLTDELFRDKIHNSCSGNYSVVQSELQAAYLGYIVVRPIPSVPIGRTVLLPMSDSADRKFDCLVEYRVHLCGIELSVQSIAFQQQDGAVGACATTATWSALQRLCRHEGNRTPTPSEITESAVKHFIPNGRPYPSTGLRIEQICDALRFWNYPPILMSVGTEHTHFKYMLSTYVKSGMPVILAIIDKEGHGGHAVTVVGYKENTSINNSFCIDSKKLYSSNLAYDEIYIHDDRIGPYASPDFSPVSCRGRSKVV